MQAERAILIMETLIDSFPETLGEMLIPTDPIMARGMASFHGNALLRCVIHAMPNEDAPALLAIAEHLASIDELLRL